MTHVTIATPTDAQLLAGVRLAMDMWNESPTYRDMPKDVNKVIEYAYTMRQSPEACVRVALVDDDTVQGFIVGTVGEYGFAHVRFATDEMLFVAKDARRGAVARELIGAFEAWAREQRASRIFLGVTTGVHTERTEKLYNALGYATVGVLTMKEIS